MTECIHYCVLRKTRESYLVNSEKKEWYNFHDYVNNDNMRCMIKNSAILCIVESFAMFRLNSLLGYQGWKFLIYHVIKLTIKLIAVNTHKLKIKNSLCPCH